VCPIEVVTVSVNEERKKERKKEIGDAIILDQLFPTLFFPFRNS